MPLPVREFFNNEKNLHLQFVSGDGGLGRIIRSPEIVRPAAAFAEGVWPAGLKKSGRRPPPKVRRAVEGSVWIFGSFEIGAIRAVPAAVRGRFMDFFRTCRPSAAIFVEGQSPAKLDASLVRQTSIPIFTSRLPYTRFLSAFHAFLQNRLAPRTNVHGTLLSIFNHGVLLQGPSGVGKSEIALSLIERGHQLVADDTVQIRLEQNRDLVGSAPELGRHHMEIRGIGILNVRQLFGISAVAEEHNIHLIVDLLSPSAMGRREERLGGYHLKRILGVEVPRVVVQVRTGRHMAVIIEAATRNQQLRNLGYDAARSFHKSLDRLLGAPRPTAKPGR
ncbi:HPr(Ser) kinase/phosphatase [bacterium]|nr:HPr(Ser) kinase/phosphatase [bacterium]